MNFLETIKCLYHKTPIPSDLEFNTQLNITLNKWLGFDRNNIMKIKSIMPYMFYIEPKHYFYLLFLSIPESYDIPFFRKGFSARMKAIEEEKSSKLLDKIKYVMGWSEKELRYNKYILENTVQKDEKYWKKELGVY